MRLAIRLLSVAVILTFGARHGGNPAADTIAMELKTEVVMTAWGLAIVPVVAPAKVARGCSLPTVNFRAYETQRQVIEAVVNRELECSLRDAAEKK